MKYIFCSLVVIHILSTSLLSAQTDVTIRKKDFENDKTGFEAAWKHVTEGDLCYRKKGAWYGTAFEEYLQAIAYNSKNPELNYKTGVSALFSDNKEKAIIYLQKVLDEKSDLTEDVLFLTGRALQFAGKYNEAIETLNAYLESPLKKPEKNVADAHKYVEECKSALEVLKDTLKISIMNVGSSINSNADEYSEIITEDGNIMFFASRRELARSSDYDDAKFDENIFVSPLVNGSWGVASIAGENLTTKYCETPVYLDSAGEELYLYVGYENGGDIKVSYKKKGEWKIPQAVPFRINTTGSETSLTFSPSGNEIWFVTDKGKEGTGGKDIYFIRKLDEKKWSKPINAGPSFNTSHDEESVRFSDGGDTLWFSSKGHNTIGGFDIFYCVRDSADTWCMAENPGYPVNTPWDELFYFPVKDDDSLFYFASNRIESMGGLDIFQGKILPREEIADLSPVVGPDTITVSDTAEVTKEILQPPVVKRDTAFVSDTTGITKEVVQPPFAPMVIGPEQNIDEVFHLIGYLWNPDSGNLLTMNYMIEYRSSAKKNNGEFKLF